jgi:hypothetical protein
VFIVQRTLAAAGSREPAVSYSESVAAAQATARTA